MASALRPWAASSLAAERTACSFQSANTTEAPDSAKAFAVARPSPDPAPVTSATLFSKDMFIMSSSFDLRVELWLVRALFENILPARHRRKDVGPTDIEGQMRDDLRGLRPRHPVIHPLVEGRCNLGYLPVGD